MKNELASKNVLVYGLGKTGEKVVDFLEQMKAKIVLCDDIKEGFFAGKEILKPQNVKLKAIDLIVLSPGVAIRKNKIIDKAIKLSINIVSEIELANAYSKGKMFAITGTNGKTTTVSLLSHVFNTAHRENALCGNVGTPLIEKVMENKKNTYVVECSSFQLEICNNFQPFCSAFLNITPDHIERHGGFENYFLAKQNILLNQTKRQYCVLNFDDESVRKLFQNTQAKTYFFSTKTIVKGAYIHEGKIFTYINKPELICKCKDVKLIGKKNLENVLCVCCMARIAGIKPRLIAKGLASFEPIEHRLEFVAKKCGVDYINDSKATNCASTNFACESFSQKIILLLGGQGKGQDFSALTFNDNIDRVVVYGEDRDLIFDSVSKVMQADKIDLCETMKEAFKIASHKARIGNIVLLSPACASFDEFKDYIERGHVFRKLVEEL